MVCAYMCVVVDFPSAPPVDLLRLIAAVHKEVLRVR